MPERTCHCERPPARARFVTRAVPCRSPFLCSHPLLYTMGALIVGTVLFALVTVLAYFCVSVVWRNDKDSQAYVGASRFGQEQPLLCGMWLGQLSVVLAAVCMYIMWATCYLHQLYPLIRPIKPAHLA
ncbi:hypothetical protein I4F81_007369 [Pyropia yezoensis]|uniref:Uncharacterized protein n=1 Tax=Pyropia yezoensis TaxID=2788 RepID=A0ACC3C3T4_PYRYE|nr:hypothetical protein I4F81_007369 [Neopyropia yezoensis]